MVAFLSNGMGQRKCGDLSTRLDAYFSMRRRNETIPPRSLSVAKQVARRCIVHLFIGEKIETDGRPWHKRREGSSNSWQLISLPLLTDQPFQLPLCCFQTGIFFSLSLSFFSFYRFLLNLCHFNTRLMRNGKFSIEKFKSYLKLLK